MQQFQRVAKNSLSQLKLWSKDEFEGKQKKQEKLIKQLENLRQSNDQMREGLKLEELGIKLITC